jgi:hypothetical protein
MDLGLSFMLIHGEQFEVFSFIPLRRRSRMRRDFHKSWLVGWLRRTHKDRHP